LLFSSLQRILKKITTTEFASLVDEKYLSTTGIPTVTSARATMQALRARRSDKASIQYQQMRMHKVPLRINALVYLKPLLLLEVLGKLVYQEVRVVIASAS
jgi:hypothetical protein